MLAPMQSSQHLGHWYRRHPGPSTEVREDHDSLLCIIRHAGKGQRLHQRLAIQPHLLLSLGPEGQLAENELTAL